MHISVKFLHLANFVSAYKISRAVDELFAARGCYLMHCPFLPIEVKKVTADTKYIFVQVRNVVNGDRRRKYRISCSQIICGYGIFIKF